MPRKLPTLLLCSALTLMALSVAAYGDVASGHTPEAPLVTPTPAQLHSIERSAHLGYGPNQYRLGLLYAAGDVVQQNLPLAAYWWRKAAHNLDAAAQLQLGTAYAHGWGVPKDPAKAVYWWKQAARDGHRKIAREAQYLLDKAA